MIKHFLTFEKNIADVEGKIEDLKHISSNSDLNIAEEIGKSHDGSKDILSAQIKASAGNEAEFMQSVQDIFKLRASVEIVPTGSLKKDGIVIDDKRDIG